MQAGDSDPTAREAEATLYEQLAEEIVVDSATGRTETAMHVGQISGEINV